MIRTLADELLMFLVEHGTGPRLAEIASALSADWPSVRAAAFELDADGRAKVARCGRAFHLLTIDDPTPVCVICGAVFVRKRKSTRRTCSRSCAVALSWKNEAAKVARGVAISRALDTPENKDRIVARNKRRWSKPEERAKLSEQNRQRARDPVGKARRSLVMQEKNGTPEKRAMYSAIRKAYWADPAKRQKMLDGMRRGHGTPEARAKASARMKARWQDPVWRAKWTEANRRRNDRVRGKKLTPEQLQRRRDAVARNKSARSQGMPA